MKNLRYKDGLLKAKADDMETIQLIEGAAAGMVATVEAAGELGRMVGVRLFTIIFDCALLDTRT